MSETLKRKPVIPLRQEPSYWCNPFTGEFLTPDNTLLSLAIPETIKDILDAIASHIQAHQTQEQKAMLYLVSGDMNDDRPDISFFDVSSAGTQWKRDKFIWKKLDATYLYNNLSIRMIGTGEYWGDYDQQGSTVDLRNAKTILEKLISEAFKGSSNGRVGGPFQFQLRYTPSASGRKLLQGSLPFHHEYQVLPESVTEWIIGHYGQARIETLPPSMPVVKYGSVIDARWMYASCVDSLPLGKPLQDTQNKRHLRVNNNGYVYPAIPGFYHIETKVPENWSHIGLVKDSTLSEETGHAVYPHTPGYRFEAHVTADELAMLTQQEWKYRILERLLFPDTANYKQPLQTWNNNLIALRETAEKNPYAQHIKNAIRAIHLHTIGSMWRSYGKGPLQETPFDELPLPDNVVIAIDSDFEDYERELYCWCEQVPLSPLSKIFFHPEWVAQIWGKARRKLTEFALKLPYESLIYIHTDGMWIAGEVPEWVRKLDTGKPGSFRVKDTIPGFSWPDTPGSMREIVIDYNEQKRQERNVSHG